jgi:catechol 2,3-dioxygenase-like lactoylglutathione lyase family enzyme
VTTPFDAAITFCYVPDLETTARFYEDVLGLPLVVDQGDCRIYRVRGGGYLGFCERDAAPRPETVLLTLVTDDVEGWHKRLVQAGTPVDQEPAHNPGYKITHAFYRDPAGYRLEIQRFDDPDWARDAPAG